MIWIFLTIILGIITWIALRMDYDPLDDLPGPRKFPFLGNGVAFFGLTQEQMFDLVRNFKKIYGDRYLIKILGRRILHVSHPDDIELVLSHSKNIRKSKPYRFLEPWLGTGLLLSAGSKWHRRRKILTPAFHFNILKNFATIIEEKSRKLVLEIKNQGPEVEMDLMPLISNYTLNTICETAMGTQLDVDKSKASVEYKNAIVKIGGALLERLTRLWLHPDIIFGLTERGKLFKEYLRIVHTFADNVIKERKNTMSSDDRKIMATVSDGEDFGGKSRLAMLDLLLEAEGKGEIDLEGIREEVNTFMFEGHDTTSMAITLGLLELAKNVDVQDRMYEEYQSIFGDSDRTPTMADLAEMKYTEAVIKEVLRLFPSVPFIARRISEEFKMGDLRVKTDCEVAIHIYDVHRREEFFPQPDLFKPERFLDINSVKHPYAYIPFSAGPRNCIGQRFAMQEMKCAFSEIIRSFKLKEVSGAPRLVSDLVLRPSGSARVKFITR